MRFKNKYVTWRHLKVGQKVTGAQSSPRSRGFTGTVIDANSAYVKILIFDKYEEQFNSDEWQFEIEMPTAEFNLKYQTAAGKMVQCIQKTLHLDEIGYKEMWNTWLYESGGAYGIAAHCQQEKIMVLGHCKDVHPKTTFFGETMDVGVCAEYEDGERFWVHANSAYIQEVIDSFRPNLPEKGMCCDCVHTPYDSIRLTPDNNSGCGRRQGDGYCWTPPRLL